jgi:murein DD-endopeptidase MepM/ murein hydrolase activator NlpD
VVQWLEAIQPDAAKAGKEISSDGPTGISFGRACRKNTVNRKGRPIQRISGRAFSKMRDSLRLWIYIAVLAPLLLAAGTPSSIFEMAPPISGLTLANLQDNFEEIHSGHRHEAIDILEPRGTPVHAVVSGTIRKLFFSKPGGNTIYQFDEMGVYCYYYAHLDGYATGLQEGMHVERGDIIGFVGSTGNADPSTPHLHFAIFELGPEMRWWKGKAVNPYPGLVAAVKRAQ